MNKKITSNDPWFQHEVFEELLLIIPLCGLLYLISQLIIEASWLEMSPTLGIIMGCLGIRWVNRWRGGTLAHGVFIFVILGIFIPSWFIGGGVLNPTRYFSVIFFLLHCVLFPQIRLVYLIISWMGFTLVSLTLEAFHPEWILNTITLQKTAQGDQFSSVSAALTPIFIQSALVHLIIFVTCGTLLRRTMSAFHKAKESLQEANQVQRDLLRIVSHDLRGPINNLQLGIEAMMTQSLQTSRADLTESNEGLAFANLTPMLKLQTQHMDFLIRNLSYFRLNHSEQLSPFLEETLIEDLISQVVQGWELQAQRSHLELIYRCTHSAQHKTHVYTDRMFLKQILDNLISNALKYSSSNSQIKVQVQTHQDDFIIDVIDEGPGIPLEDQKRIFKRFERAGNPNRPREHSIGLGLWIVDLLAPLIRSKVDLIQSSDQGSTFRLTLKEAILFTTLAESISTRS